MKKLPKSIESRINEINSMLPQVDALGDFAWTYAGGTWPYQVDIEAIQVDGLTVTIKAKDQKNNRWNFITLETYDVTDCDYFSCTGLTGLKHDLSIIFKAFKKALK